MADKISELPQGRLDTLEDQRRALEAIIRKLNEVIRAVNELLP